MTWGKGLGYQLSDLTWSLEVFTCGIWVLDLVLLSLGCHLSAIVMQTDAINRSVHLLFQIKFDLN